MSTCLTDNKEDMHLYLQQIRQYPLLSPEEERLLAHRCAAGDEDAIRQMVNSNLRLVVSVAREYAGRGVPLLDLCQEGSIGLLTAAKKFDCTKNVRFSTYATKWIRQGIGRHLATHADLIRIPEYTGEQVRRLLAARASLSQKTGAEPSVDDLARECDLSVEKTEKLLGLIPEICSLDALAGEDSSLPLGAYLEDISATEPQKAFLRQELERIVSEMLAKLTSRQARILRLHFGMEDGVCHSLEEISKDLGLSKERVRQIKNQAMEKLRLLGADFGLEEFLHDMD